MREYDRTSPLIVIHIPKAAGSSVKNIFKLWFGNALYDHYFDELAGFPPPKRNLDLLHSLDRPLAIYGHFNRLRGFGIEHYYPEVQQFITILRDPFESAISSYYYIRKNGPNWKDQARVPKADLRQFLLDTPPNMLNQFPRTVTRDNYRDQIEELFIEVGIMERLSESVHLIAKKLGMPFEEEWLPHVNVTDRDQPHPQDLQEEYAKWYPLEFEVYGYAFRQFSQRSNTNVAKPSVPADSAR
jgi:hypothetical protein